MGERLRIDIRTPEKWVARGFWKWRRSRVFGLVLAFSPTMFSFGGELITGESKGAALIVGPFWLGFATLRIKDPSA